MTLPNTAFTETYVGFLSCFGWEKEKSLFLVFCSIVHTDSTVKFSMVIHYFNWTFVHISNEKFFTIVEFIITSRHIHQESTIVTNCKLCHWIWQFLRKYPPFNICSIPLLFYQALRSLHSKHADLLVIDFWHYICHFGIWRRM